MPYEKISIVLFGYDFTTLCAKIISFNIYKIESILADETLFNKMIVFYFIYFLAGKMIVNIINEEREGIPNIMWM